MPAGTTLSGSSDATGATRRPARKRPAGPGAGRTGIVAAGVVAAGLAVMLGIFLRARPGPGAAARAPAGRTLVFIVPGTYGNDEFWPNVVAGKTTFASELQRAAGPGAVVYPHLWWGGNDHRSRMQAAANLAGLIDSRAGPADRVCLVGHSHGGNIAMIAAGLCRRRVDTLVCLATPQLYLLTKDVSGKDLPVPVYCSREARDNTGRIVTVCSDTDSVPEGWADVVRGLDDNDAIAMTNAWREKLEHPRLQNDGWWAHTRSALFSSGNLRAVRPLEVADANVTQQSYVSDLFGTASHSSIHSRRMGYVVGELCRDGATEARVGYLRGLLQPSDADEGNPAGPESAAAWNAAFGPRVSHAGWRLTAIAVHLPPDAGERAKNVAGKTPAPYLFITDGAGRKLYRSPSAGDTLEAAWKPAFVLFASDHDSLAVWAHHALKFDTSLGKIPLDGGTRPPAFVPADPAAGVYWSADLTWEAVHY